jgi:hypothetical protein
MNFFCFLFLLSIYDFMKTNDRFDVIILSDNSIGEIVFKKLQENGVSTAKFYIGETNPEEIVSKDCELFVLCSDKLEKYEFFNRMFNSKRKKWISVRMFDYVGEIGPVVIPKRTACFKCYATRKLSTDYPERKEDASIDLKKKDICTEIVSDILVLKIMKIVGNNADIKDFNSVIEIDPISNAIFKHTILKVPNCEGCGV